MLPVKSNFFVGKSAKRKFNFFFVVAAFPVFRHSLHVFLDAFLSILNTLSLKMFGTGTISLQLIKSLALPWMAQNLIFN
jgi:hypothetical protein